MHCHYTTQFGVLGSCGGKAVPHIARLVPRKLWLTMLNACMFAGDALGGIKLNHNPFSAIKQPPADPDRGARGPTWRSSPRSPRPASRAGHRAHPGPRRGHARHREPARQVGSFADILFLPMLEDGIGLISEGRFSCHADNTQALDSETSDRANTEHRPCFACHAASPGVMHVCTVPETQGFCAGSRLRRLPDISYARGEVVVLG